MPAQARSRGNRILEVRPVAKGFGDDFKCNGASFARVAKHIPDSKPQVQVDHVPLSVRALAVSTDRYEFRTNASIILATLLTGPRIQTAIVLNANRGIIRTDPLLRPYK